MSDKRERPTEGLPPPATPYLPVQTEGVHVKRSPECACDPS
jgi:hypothetical protein